MEEAIKKVVLKFLGEGTRDISKLYGDASYRTYFRVGLDSGTSIIIMKMPDGISSASEEVTNYKGKKGDLPYINISNYLRSLGVAVPEVKFYDKDAAMIGLEDLGDELFFNNVSQTDDGEKFKWYSKATDLLLKVQERTSKGGDTVAFRRSFDATLLNWEFDHFWEYGVEARGARPSSDVRQKFEAITREITSEITGMEYGFTHRDFQSRNIMVKDGQFYLIDFQDALLGPRTYDLVSLLRDSYVIIGDVLLDRLLEYYSKKGGLGADIVRKDFYLVTIQRKLKDAGRFVYIDRVKKNPNYLKHIPRSLEYVKKAILKTPKYSELLEILKPYTPEFAA